MYQRLSCSCRSLTNNETQLYKKAQNQKISQSSSPVNDHTLILQKFKIPPSLVTCRDVPRFRIVVAARHKVECRKLLQSLILCMSKLNSSGYFMLVVVGTDHCQPLSRGGTTHSRERILNVQGN